MNKKQLLFGTTVIGLSLAIASTGFASAAGNFGKKAGNQNRQIVREAVASGDYQAWVQALEGHERIPFELTETTFNAFEEAHALLEDGNREGAAEVLEEAGIELPEKLRGHKHGRGNEEVRAAIEDGNFSNWQAAVADTKLADVATEEVFNKMLAIHEAREAGDRDTVKELRQELRELIKSLKSN